MAWRCACCDRVQGGHIFGNIGKAHTRAQKCPFRDKSKRGAAFTMSEATTWLGLQYKACDECKVPPAVRDKLLRMYAGYGFKFIGIAEEY